MSTQEIAYKEKRPGDVRDSWYIRPGFESLLDETLDHQHHSGEGPPADADTKDRAKVRLWLFLSYPLPPFAKTKAVVASCRSLWMVFFLCRNRIRIRMEA